MNVFLYEHATCSNDPLPRDILLEGIGMFKSLYEGFKKFSTVKTFTLRKDIPFSLNFFKNKDVIDVFIKFAESSDFSLIVAPEDDGLLYKLTKIIEKTGSKNLGSPSRGVFETSDKYLTYKKIKNFSPRTEIFNGKTSLNLPFVAKPRVSCSCEGIFIVRSEKDMERIPEGYIVQEFVDGIDMSASLIVGDEIKLISINRQILSKKSNFKLKEIVVPGEVSSGVDLEPIFKSVERFDLFGYVGVDFIVSNDTVFVIEINPRITTSVVAFEKVYGYNISEIIFKNYYKERFEIKFPRKSVRILKTNNYENRCFVKIDKLCLALEEINDRHSI